MSRRWWYGLIHLETAITRLKYDTSRLFLTSYSQGSSDIMCNSALCFTARWPTCSAGRAVIFTPWMPGLATKWLRLAPNGTNPGLFQIRFQYILGNLIWKSPGFVPFGGQSDRFEPKSMTLKYIPVPAVVITMQYYLFMCSEISVNASLFIYNYVFSTLWIYFKTFTIIIYFVFSFHLLYSVFLSLSNVYFLI